MTEITTVNLGEEIGTDREEKRGEELYFLSPHKKGGALG